MYCVKKVLNNNAVQAVDLVRKEEVIFLGKGVGFNRKVNEPFEDPKGIKKYHLYQKTAKGPAEALLKGVDPVFLEIADAIIKLTEEKYDGVDNNVLLPLADHIAFSLVRMESRMDLSNPFVADIKMLFEEEYAIALKGKEIIRERTGKMIPDDEVSYITLYINLSLSGQEVSQSLKIPMIIRRSIERIERECSVSIDRGSYAYNRLFYHIRCMLARVNNSEKLNDDLVTFAKEKCAYAYDVAAEICRRLSTELSETFGEQEISYLALHIERIRNV